MKDINNSLFNFRAMDKLTAQLSPMHELDPLVKLLTTIIYIFVVLSFGKYDLSGVSVMVLYPAGIFAVSGLSAARCLCCMRLPLLFVCILGLCNLLLDSGAMVRLGPVVLPCGCISAVSLLFKGVFCLSASFLFIATTGIDALCASLRRTHVPDILVMLLLLTYRYIGVMMEEVAIMTQGYHLRSPKQRGIRFAAWGSFLGQLILRSMDKAERIYSAMLLRGFAGEYRYAEAGVCRRKDIAFLLLSVSGLLLLRIFNVARILGGLII